MACTDKFIAELRDRGMRMTPQREIVLAVLHELPEHEPVEEIFRRVQARSTAIDRSTVYRTLDLLQDMHMLVMTEAADGQRCYALKGLHTDHVHLICRKCGRDITVDAGPFRALAAQVRGQSGFELDLVYRSLSGLCQACAEAGGTPRADPDTSMPQAGSQRSSNRRPSASNSESTGS